MSDFIYPQGDVSVAQAFKSGQLTVEGTVVKLADATGVEEADVACAHAAILTFSGGDLRYRFDGTDPTTSAGLLRRESTGELIVVGAANLKKLRLVRDGGAATITLDFQLGRVK